ncbi:Glyceraldehyde-3-phosphate dehydrogenase type I [Candidatus Trichorickettsia mobilis]|uniref:Glyceraldehyde-3-phosphate dehydrogenase type I n=1 Tax=Candidatus Trichorickettsia mobilis TaxID=1346319 RepID=A0ABZ0UVB0_9RICK|nr:type I glyceraldehyde-3-phosphate dehydrogenase [Candidatus Trichorickettsia mobilis]WPY00864.1 Glyceraldehyde-3-phosphate dehydrogenase type I [Candidatus Trichorickettsia mobilis]
MNIAINGLGRIGRLVFRSAIARGDHQIVALNTPSDISTVCHLINYDSIHGRSDIIAKAGDRHLIIQDQQIPVFHHQSPADIPWKDFDVDIVLECSGKFTDKNKAAFHLASGAKKVIISAPAVDVDKIIIIGINHQDIAKNDDIISIGSCTTNALVPVAKVLHDHFNIEAGYVTTIHAYTGDQNIVDASHKDLQRARAAFTSMIPTKTGAAATIGLVLPELKGKLDGSAVRVPVANVSLIDFTFTASKKLEIFSINEAMINASNSYLKGILGIAAANLVSIDFNHTSYSSIFDPSETKIVTPYFARVLSWYDNEWAFAQRMLDCCDILKKFL